MKAGEIRLGELRREFAGEQVRYFGPALLGRHAGRLEISFDWTRWAGRCLGSRLGGHRGCRLCGLITIFDADQETRDTQIGWAGTKRCTNKRDDGYGDHPLFLTIPFS